MKKTFSIIIVNWNTSEMLQNCLSSLSKCSIYDEAKVIVIDNNSTDDSRIMVKTMFPTILLVNSGCNLGFGRANNLAAEYIEGDYILFLNPDTLVLYDSIKKMKSVLEKKSEIGALGCKMKSPSGEVQELGIQWYPNPISELFRLLFISSYSIKLFKNYVPYQNPYANGYVKKLYGGCLFVRKSVLDKIGWFDDRFFMYGEDVDLCRRISKSGWKLYYMKDAEIIHIGGGANIKTTSDFSVLMMCESISKLIRKYNGFPGYIFYKIAIFFGSSIRLSILLCMSNLPYLKRYVPNYEQTSKKYMTMVRWSLSLQRPSIPS